MIEVADTTLFHDRGWKRYIYARDGLGLSWIVNLVDNQLEVYTQPAQLASGPDYQQQTTYRPGNRFPVVIEGKEVGQLAVVDLLP